VLWPSDRVLAVINQAGQEGWVRPEPPARETGRSVAVIGSGPAGMAAAQQLRRAGHRVVLYERDEAAGGLVRFGVPDFKITLNNRKILDGLFDTLGLGHKSSSILRALDKVAKVGRDKVIDDLQQVEGGAGLTSDQARRILDFVQGERTEPELYTSIYTHPRTMEGLDNLETIVKLLRAVGVPDERLGIDRQPGLSLGRQDVVVVEIAVQQDPPRRRGIKLCIERLGAIEERLW